MRHGDIKIKFRVKDLIKALEDGKKRQNNKYETDLVAYNAYAKKLAPKISAEIRKLADQIDELNFTNINTRYSNMIGFEIRTKLREKPSKPNTNQIDSTLEALKISSDEFITIKQSEYDSLL
jgi:hypothetical protein